MPLEAGGDILLTKPINVKLLLDKMYVYGCAVPVRNALEPFQPHDIASR